MSIYTQLFVVTDIHAGDRVEHCRHRSWCRHTSSILNKRRRVSSKPSTTNTDNVTRELVSRNFLPERGARMIFIQALVSPASSDESRISSQRFNYRNRSLFQGLHRRRGSAMTAKQLISLRDDGCGRRRKAVMRC